MSGGGGGGGVIEILNIYNLIITNPENEIAGDNSLPMLSYITAFFFSGCNT